MLQNDRAWSRKQCPSSNNKQPHRAQHFAAGHRLTLIFARPDQQEVFREQRHLDQRRFGHRQRNNCRVEPSVCELFNQLRRQRLTDMNVELGMHSREVADDLRQQIGRNRRDHADAQPAREPVTRRAREVFQFIDQAQDVADAWSGLFSERGERDLPGASLQQHASQRVLQVLDLHRQSRLRDRTCFCRAPEVALTGQRIEIAQLPKRDHKKILP